MVLASKVRSDLMFAVVFDLKMDYCVGIKKEIIPKNSFFGLP